MENKQRQYAIYLERKKLYTIPQYKTQKTLVKPNIKKPTVPIFRKRLNANMDSYE